jgi:hypothetical protein
VYDKTFAFKAAFWTLETPARGQQVTACVSSRCAWCRQRTGPAAGLCFVNMQYVLVSVQSSGVHDHGRTLEALMYGDGGVTSNCQRQLGGETPRSRSLLVRPPGPLRPPAHMQHMHMYSTHATEWVLRPGKRNSGVQRGTTRRSPFRRSKRQPGAWGKQVAVCVSSRCAWCRQRTGPAAVSCFVKMHYAEVRVQSSGVPDHGRTLEALMYGDGCG